MNRLIRSSSKLSLVAGTTLFSIVTSLSIFYVLYGILDVPIRRSEILVGILAPLLIASFVSWYLYGLIKELERLEQELRHSITKEKEEVYLATIHGAQHITNNLLHGLILIEMEIQKHPAFDPKRKRQFHDLVAESQVLMRQLSSVDAIEAQTIREAVAPK